MDLLEPRCQGDGGATDSVFEIVPDSNGILSAHVQSAAAYDLVLSLKSACSAGNADTITCANDFDGTKPFEDVWTTVTAGVPVFVVVDGKGGADGPFTVHVEVVPPVLESEPNAPGNPADGYMYPFQGDMADGDVDVVVYTPTLGPNVYARLFPLPGSPAMGDDCDQNADLVWYTGYNGTTLTGPDGTGGHLANSKCGWANLPNAAAGSPIYLSIAQTNGAAWSYGLLIVEAPQP
jgi:hypothetical protein